MILDIRMPFRTLNPYEDRLNARRKEIRDAKEKMYQYQGESELNIMFENFRELFFNLLNAPLAIDDEQEKEEFLSVTTLYNLPEGVKNFEKPSGWIMGGSCCKEKIESPEAYNCPISLDLMEDPVVASDGHTYERALIKKLVKSPLTREDLFDELRENRVLKAMIVSFKKKPRMQIQELRCPLTGEPFKDPVIASDGYTYEREALLARIKESDLKSPTTGEELFGEPWTNWVLRSLIQEQVSSTQVECSI